jgi:hypothetical protein
MPSESRFAADSPLERTGFVLAVPSAQNSPQDARRQFQGTALYHRDPLGHDEVKQTMI